MQASLLPLLRCPVSRRPLVLAGAEEVARFAAAISRGEVQNAVGAAVTTPPDGLLVADDRRRAYLVRDGIPILLPEEAVPPPAA